MNSSGDITRCVVPSRHGVLSWSLHLPGGVALHPLVGQRRAGDVAAQLLQRFTVIGVTAYGGGPLAR